MNVAGKRVTQAEFARLCGVNRSTVNRWLKNARIEADAHGLIDPEAAHKMRDLTESPMPHHQARKAQFDEGREWVSQGGAEKISQIGETGADSDATLGKEEVAHRRNVAVMLEREWTARQKEIEARRAAGELYEKEKVRDAWRSAFIVLRSTMESVPDRASSELAARRGDVAAIHHDLAGVIADALRECADAFARKLDGIN